MRLTNGFVYICYSFCQFGHRITMSIVGQIKTAPANGPREQGVKVDQLLQASYGCNEVDQALQRDRNDVGGSYTAFHAKVSRIW